MQILSKNYSKRSLLSKFVINYFILSSVNVILNLFYKYSSIKLIKFKYFQYLEFLFLTSTLKKTIFIKIKILINKDFN